jgi:hypothetical protein
VRCSSKTKIVWTGCDGVTYTVCVVCCIVYPSFFRVRVASSQDMHGVSSQYDFCVVKTSPRLVAAFLHLRRMTSPTIRIRAEHIHESLSFLLQTHTLGGNGTNAIAKQKRRQPHTENSSAVERGLMSVNIWSACPY